MSNVLPFTDEFAPLWTNPDTGVRMPMTAAAWRAAGYEVRALPVADWYAVDLSRRVKPLEPPHAATRRDNPAASPP